MIPSDGTANHVRHSPKPAPTARTRTARQCIIIARPVEEVFAAGSALDKRSEWQRGILAGVLTDPVTAGLGARCTETRSAPGDTTEPWELEITGFVQDGLLTIVARCDPIHIVERHVFERDQASPGQTRYTLSLEMTGSQLAEAGVQKQMVDRLISFRLHVENPNEISGVARSNATRQCRSTGPTNDPNVGRER